MPYSEPSSDRGEQDRESPSGLGPAAGGPSITPDGSHGAADPAAPAEPSTAAGDSPLPDAAADDAEKARFTLLKPDGQPVRTGRNLPVAIASGVALGALVLITLYPWPQAFTAITALATLLGLRELRRALAGRGTGLSLVPLAVGGVAMQVCAYFGGTEWLVGAFALTVIVALSWRLRGGAAGYVRDASANLFAAAYLPLLLSTWLLMLAEDDGRLRLIVFILVTISSDIGGYFAGILLGRHKMAPVISPNKTWEGFGGSVVACVAAGVVTVTLMLDGAWWAGALLGVAVVFAATVGDLIESLVKRDLGIKDMGHFMPGHGGLLDRVDSLLIGGPVSWMVLTLLVPPGG